MKRLLLLSCSLAIAAAMQAQIIHVPGDYPTIQQGINAAAPGDTVLVAEGTYYEQINFLGKKPLMLASEFLMDGDTNHIANTIINGSLPVNPDIGSVVTFESGEDTTSVVCGFTITGGTGTVEPSVNVRMGGGVHIKYSGGKLLNNYIQYNTVSYNGGARGGGLQTGGPISEIPWIVLRGNRIDHNQAISINDYASGGGFICYYNLIMTDNQISNNEANGHMGCDGAGVEFMGAFGLIELNIRDNQIIHNEAVTDMGSTNYAALGGGMSIAFDCMGTIANNDFSFNNVEAPDNYWSYGPGVFIEEITSNGFVFENNLIRSNIANTQNCLGGGLSLLRSGGKYQNNVIQNNLASDGGGVWIGESQNVSDSAIFINNTITNNEAAFGGGINLLTSDAVVINSIIWGNTASSGPSFYEQQSTLEVRYSDVEGADVWPGEGNIYVEPQFLADGYHLDNTSVLVNEGISTISINGASYDCPGYDIDGDARPFANTPPEIGVDEVPVFVGELTLTNSLAINVYPDPADQLVTISVKNGAVIKEVSIFNQIGQTVYKGMPDDNTLDVSELQPGIYIIVVCYNQQRFRGKLIIE
jgi:hypothetical protein